MVATTFWETFFLLFLFLPLVMIWGFAFVDIFKREDISGWSKALWIVCVLVVPFFGTLISLVARPAGVTREERLMMGETDRDYVARYSQSDEVAELRALADLHDRGKRLPVCELGGAITALRVEKVQQAGSAALIGIRADVAGVLRLLQVTAGIQLHDLLVGLKTFIRIADVSEDRLFRFARGLIELGNRILGAGNLALIAVENRNLHAE